MKIYIYIPKENILPDCQFGELVESEIKLDGYNVSDATLSMVRNYLETLTIPNRDTANDDTMFGFFHDVVRNVELIVNRRFAIARGKRMIAKYPGKTIDGQAFEAGADIYYWSNGFDKMIVLV